jgi:hypothetical protein
MDESPSEISVFSIQVNIVWVSTELKTRLATLAYDFCTDESFAAETNRRAYGYDIFFSDLTFWISFSFQFLLLNKKMLITKLQKVNFPKVPHRDMANWLRTLSKSTIDMDILMTRRRNLYGIFLRERGLLSRLQLAHPHLHRCCTLNNVLDLYYHFCCLLKTKCYW